MKKIMKNIAAATLAVAAFAATLAAHAGGDIYEILRVNAAGEAIPNPTDYLKGGDEVRFAVRLVKPAVSGAKKFRLVNTTTLPDSAQWYLDLTFNCPWIKIFVNGEPEYAKLESVRNRDEADPDVGYFTDLIFVYTVKPGDFAMPVRLADKDGKQVIGDEAPGGYQLSFDVKGSPWRIDDSTDSTPMTRTASFVYAAPGDVLHVSPPDGDRHSDYDLSGCGFRVKTLDFAPGYEEESEGIWRIVHEHATAAQPAGSVPRITVDGMPVTTSTKIYIWSENPEAVELVAGGNVKSVLTNVDVYANAPASEKPANPLRTVGMIEIFAGNQNYDFSLRGVLATNDATIVMSAFPYFNYSAGSAETNVVDYLTRKVRCIGPLPASVSVNLSENEVTATGGYQEAVSALTVSLSQNPLAEDLEVELVTTFTEAARTNWWDYIRLSAVNPASLSLFKDASRVPAADRNPVLVFPAGKTVPTKLRIQTVSGTTIEEGVNDGKVYVFSIRSDSHVNGVDGILTMGVATTNTAALKPSEEGGIDNWGSASDMLTIYDPIQGGAVGESGVVSALDFAGSVNYTNMTVGVEYPLDITVFDAFADMESAEGYALEFEPNVNAGFVALEGRYKLVGGYLVSTNDMSTKPTVVYTASGSKSSRVRLTSPVSGKSSTASLPSVTLRPPAGYYVETTDGKYDFKEGDAVQLTVTIDSEWGCDSDIWAFIAGEKEEDLDAISCSWKAAQGGVGIQLKANNTTLSRGCDFQVIDGDESPLGSTHIYEVVFLNQSTWTTNSSARVTQFASRTPLVIKTHNVQPSVKNVSIGRYTAKVNGETIGGLTPTKFPMGITNTLSVSVNEPGELDLTSTNFPFQVRWLFSDESGYTVGPTKPVEASDSGIVSGNPKTTKCEFDFPAAGLWTVTVELKDKDMSDWTEAFEFHVNVVDQPRITIRTDNGGRFYEQDCLDFSNEGNAKLYVDLDLNACTFDLYVNLAITANSAGGGTGTFLLKENSDVVKQPDGTYNVRFYRNSTQTIYLQTLDGTDDSSTDGFTITPTMVTDMAHLVPNSGNKHPHEYYVGVPEQFIYVYNEAPLLDEQFDVTPVPGTNAIPASIGAAPSKITWKFKDVSLDFERGITVEFSGGGGETWGPRTYTNRTEAIADGRAGFLPSFKTGGEQSVMLTISDQDGGSVSVVWKYTVEQSKSMTLVAHGPASGDVTKYNSAAGLGQGRVWAESNSAIAADSFSSTINCGLSTSWRVYGYGYKVGDLDDGKNLHRPDGFGGYTTAPAYYDDRDTPLNGVGANKGADAAFAYVAPLDVKGNPVDSFLYAWMLKAASQEGGSFSFSFLNETTSPEHIAVGRDSGKTVELPAEQDDSGKYAATTLEAIFSIEYLASDNMGDINLDGIPDVYVNKYGFGQVDTEAGTASGTDVAKLDAFNDDADFLPPIETSAYGTLIPGLAGSWITAGRPFTAKLEIRGNGESLNDAPDNNSWTRIAGLLPDRVYTDPDVDTKSTLDGYDGDMPVEYLAWLDYAAANGLDPADTNNWTKWSPERPTDPTVADTDGDGLPDGYEYFIWYRAHVGYNDGGVHRYLTGRAYDPRNPGDGKFIPREVIEAAFDPVRANSEFSDAQDTDNDGLPDLVEFAIGTNPIDFDTDGDGLPDGYEIMIAATSPLHAYTTTGICDAMRNYDGDAMAYSSPYYETHYMTPTPKHTTSLSKFALVDADGYTDGVQWFVMPTASVPKTKLVYSEGPSSEGLFFEADGNKYVTVETNLLTITRGGRDYLAADMSPERTWLAGTYADTNGVDRVVRLMPTRLAAGTVVSGASVTNFGYVTFPADVHESLSAWPYGRSVSTETTGDSLANLGGFGFLAIGRYKTAKAGYKLACLPVVDDSIAYLHHQVYQEFGFDPRTAWNANTPLGSRWGTALGGLDDIGIDIGVNKANNVSAAFNHAAVAARTREYTLYDEFLVMSFFLNGLADGIMKVQPTTDRPWYIIWSQYTTNGRGPNEPGLSTGDENYKGRDVEAGSADENGADTDGDGVPDGWELYVMTGPKKRTVINGVEAYRFVFPAPEGDGYMSSFGPFVPHAKNAGMTDNTVEQVSLKTGYTTIGGDGDDLNEYREFAGTDTTLYYASYSTTITRPEEDAKWLNKFFPTDPWDADTDDDGLDDKSEGSGNGPRGGGWGFVYGSPADNGKLVSIPGGGLNPCSVDTDLDGLPDMWEFQFNGETIYSGEDATYAASDNGQGNPLEGLIDGMDGTVMDAFTIPNGRLTELGGIGTVNLTRAADGTKMFGKINRDYDNDGLENWQEYMTGTMRCWRYDDIESAWDAIPDNAYWNANGEFAPNYDLINARYGSLEKPVIDTSAADGGRGEFWYKTLVDRSSPIYNPRLITDQAPGDRYLSRVENVWDPAYVDDENGGAWYYFHNRIGTSFLSEIWAKPFMKATGIAGGISSPIKYISCSPIDYDSDHDGMDDYYELFHGMNPLLGGDGVLTSTEGSPCDLVRDAWGGSDSIWKAWDDNDPRANFWTYQVAINNYYKTGSQPRGNGYDFEYFPWLNGLATADPDGDDIRNQNEAIMPKLASFAWHHTDPTPLWMTDSSYARSLTRLFYRMPGRGHYAPTLGDTFKYKNATYYFADFGGWAPADIAKDLPARFVAYSSDLRWGIFGVNERNWMFSFEENEGYDSDHDAMSDSAESAGKLRATSDPQDANSPNRRQAMYFQGPSKPSALQSPPEILEKYPVTQESWPNETTFLQFTVEAWVNADTLDDATVVERAVWCAKSKPGDEEYVRKNFQLGIKGGKWYAKYDGNGTIEGTSVEIFSSDDAEAGKWHHLAATYDGARFILYVDGTEAATPVETSLQPEYGSSAMVFHRNTSFGPYPYTPGDYWYDMDYTLRPIVIGASLKTQAELAELGPVADQAAAFDVHNGAGWNYYNRFFKGFIDEVRIWDGARTVADIRADMRKRYTRTEAIENRTAFYEGWVKYGNRYGRDSDGDAVSIVPELRYHFSFDSVPGGADEGITAKAPAGFDYYHEADPAYDIRESGAAYLSRPVDWHVAWWTKVVNGDGTPDAPGYGSVYGSTNWVQWVPNTVAHLPRFDGTTLDSFFWSENTCGDEEGSYFFARNAEPASRWTQFTYNGVPDWRYYCTSPFRHHLVCELDGLVVKSDDDSETYTNDLRRTASRFTMFRFTGRTSLQDGLDMLPLGGAYAKICPEMWDGQGVSTIWEITSDDDDNNGLPDAWEDHAKGSYSPESLPIEWDTIVTWNGRRMTAGEAYRHDIATGRIVYTDSSGDSTVATTPLVNMKMTADEDASHTPDWWDDLYGVYGEGGTTDTDNDGLNNYVEYLVSEIFPFNISLDPKKPKSDSTTLDYFRTVGKLYLGEMFTDHDHMEDHWERAAASDTIDANVWDAQRDGDEDGWSNFAEVRYNDWCRPIDANIIAHSVGGNEVIDAPMPAIRLSVRYNGERDLAANLLPNLHVATYSDAAMAKADASFVVPMGTMTEGEDFYIGRWSDRIIRGTFTPGNVSYANIELHRAGQSGSDGYSWIDTNGDYHYQRPYSEYLRYRTMGWIRLLLTEKGLTWYQLGASPDNTDEGLSFTVNVDGTMSVNGQTVGVIDLVTGDFELDLSKLAAQYDNKSYKDSIYKLKYSYKVPDAQFEKVDVSLAQPSSGFVRGGRNSIMAYWDVNNDGEYTPGTDPFGVARDVEVGWRECSVEIEVSETSAITPRIKLWQTVADDSSGSSGGSGAVTTSDRLARFGQYQTTGDLTTYVPSAALNAIRVRVVRLEVDGKKVFNINGVKNPWRVLMDRTVDYGVRNWLHEGDLLGDGALDIDWDYMYDDLNVPSLIKLKYDLTNVVYAIVFGDGNIPTTSTALDSSLPVHPVLITRRFEHDRTEPTAVSLNGDSVCHVAQPTFRWKIENEDPWASAFGTTYTAFKVKVWDSSGVEVYDSGYQRMPAADSTGVYNWTAPLYVDCPSPSGSHLVFHNFTNYTWKVYTYNSKFKNDGNGSAAETFRMNVTEVDMSSFGTGIDVRYAGPATNLVGRLHVQAFKTPDFTGIPAAEAVTNESGVVNLTGLRAGTYFLRAYIDTDYDWTLDDWESWGYLSERDHGATTSTKSIFSPVSVTVGPNLKPDTPRILYIEDRDTDGDGFPDAWEAEQNGNVFSRQAIGPVTGDAEFIAVNTNLNAVLNSADTMDALKRNQLMQMFLLGRGGVYGVSLLTGASVRSLKALSGALHAAGSVVEDTVSITSLAIDRATGEVVLGVGAETEADSIDPLVAALYSVASGTVVTVKVYRTETLAAEWELAATIENVSLSSAGTEVRVKLPDGLDTSSGFFKVEIE